MTWADLHTRELWFVLTTELYSMEFQINMQLYSFYSWYDKMIILTAV